MKEVTDAGLDAIIKRHALVSVAFLERGKDTTTHYIPELEEAELRLKRKVPFCMINFGENPAAFRKYNVPYRPTLVVYKRAAEIRRYEGPYSTRSLVREMRKILRNL